VVCWLLLQLKPYSMGSQESTSGIGEDSGRETLSPDVILIMDILEIMFNKAEDAGLLQQLSSRKRLQQISMYADDVVLFLHPTTSDISVTLDILQLFGDASGVYNNAHKSNIFPIKCPKETLLEVQTLLPCGIAAFLCRYLGLPLSLRKFSRQHFQPFVEKVDDQLPNRKADLMTTARRRIQVQHVLKA
jgi:hypothetical protein